MVVAVIVLAFIILFFIFRILKLKLLVRLVSHKGRRSLALNVAIYSIRVLSFEFGLHTDENKHIRIICYKKGRLRSDLTLREIADRLMFFAQRFKNGFGAVENKTPGKLKKYLGKRSFVIESLLVELEIGFVDAYVTAMLNGFMYVLVDALLAILYSAKGIPAKTLVDIKPYFFGDKFSLHFECLVSLPLSTAAAMGLGLVFLFLRNKIRKEYRLQKEKSGGSARSG